MKKLLIIVVLFFIAGCGEMTYQEKQAWSNFWQNFSLQQNVYQEQRLRQAQYDYYKRPYRVGENGPTIYP